MTRTPTYVGRERGMKDYYARRAAEYEEVYAKPERQEDLGRLRDYLGGVFRGRDVLEVACGTGYWTQCIARSAKAILATDAGREVLDIARAKDYGRCRVRFARADAYALAGIPSRHDAAFLGYWWSHVPVQRLAGFLAGLHGRLEAGSRVVVIDNRFVAGSSTPVSRRDGAGNTYQVRALKDGSRHEVLKNFPTEGFLREHLGGPGRGLELTFLDHYWIADYRMA